MFSFFKKKSPVQQTVQTMQHSVWKTGKWVMTPDGIGILAKFKTATTTEVDLVAQDGTTKLVAEYPLLSLRLAKYDEIPDCRMQITKEAATKRGYF